VKLAEDVSSYGLTMFDLQNRQPCVPTIDASGAVMPWFNGDFLLVGEKH